MRAVNYMTIAMLSFGVAMSDSFAATPNVQVAPNQQIRACPKITTGPNKRPAVVCNANILAGGGNPLSGYTFTVKPGNTLPQGIFIMALTGVATLQSANSNVPGASKNFQIVATDGLGRQGTGTISLFIDRSAICGCPIFSVMTGPMPQARANIPYAVTLPVFGPPSSQVLRPNYVWKLANGSRLPKGLVLDQARGVVRGTPLPSAVGNHEFTVTVRETHTGQDAFVPTPYTLRVR